MKIAKLTSQRRRVGLSPLKARIFQYLKEHSDEVFSYRDERVAEQLSIKISAFSFTLWALHRDGLIGKEEVDGKVYFGSLKAIADLRAKLGIEGPRDPFERARTNLERMRAQSGNVNTLELLDAVRGPWE